MKFKVGDEVRVKRYSSHARDFATKTYENVIDWLPSGVEEGSIGIVIDRHTNDYYPFVRLANDRRYLFFDGNLELVDDLSEPLNVSKIIARFEK